MNALRSPRNKLLVAAAALGAVLLLGALSQAGAVPGRWLLAVAALPAIAVLWKKKGGVATGEEPRLRVLARTGLSQRCGLALVEADGRTVLVAFGDGFAELLERKPAPAKRRTAKKAVRP